MKFYKQLDNKSCQIVALQTVLSYFNLYPTSKEIKYELPKHSYGNTIEELAEYLNLQGIKTEQLSNKESAAVSEKVIGDKPVIINVDWYKIKSEESGRGPHYVVAIKENNSIMLYDGSNYSRKVKTSFEFLLNASKNINRFGHNGAWLICK